MRTEHFKEMNAGRCLRWLLRAKGTMTSKIRNMPHYPYSTVRLGARRHQRDPSNHQLCRYCLDSVSSTPLVKLAESLKLHVARCARGGVFLRPLIACFRNAVTRSRHCRKASGTGAVFEYSAPETSDIGQVPWYHVLPMRHAVTTCWICMVVEECVVFEIMCNAHSGEHNLTECSQFTR